MMIASVFVGVSRCMDRASEGLGNTGTHCALHTHMTTVDILSIWELLCPQSLEAPGVIALFGGDAALKASKKLECIQGVTRTVIYVMYVSTCAHIDWGTSRLRHARHVPGHPLNLAPHSQPLLLV